MADVNLSCMAEVGSRSGEEEGDARRNEIQGLGSWVAGSPADKIAGILVELRQRKLEPRKHRR